MEKRKDKQKIKLKKKLKRVQNAPPPKVDSLPKAESNEEESDGSIIDYNQVYQPKKILKKRKRDKLEEDKGQEEESKDSMSHLDKTDKMTFFLDFELVAPCESYFHSVKALLNQLLDGEEQIQLDTSEIADYVVGRPSIGSMIASSLDKDPETMPEYKNLSEDEFQKVVLKLNNDRDVYGFASILSLKRELKKLKSFQHIVKYVQKKAKDVCTEVQIQELDEALKKKNVGLLLNERLVNLPLKLIPDLHSSLPEDLKFTKKQDDIEDPREFDYDYLLVISRFTVPNTKSSSKLKKKKKSLGGNSSSQERSYYKFEDEVFSKAADISFAFKTTFRDVDEAGNQISIVGGGGPETHYKLVYLIKFGEYVKRIQDLGQYLPH